MPTRLQWSLIGGVSLLLLLLVLSTSLYSTRQKLESAKEALHNCEAAHKVSNASIRTLEDRLAAVLAEQQKLSESDEARIKASKEALAVADAASQWREAARDRLLASASRMQPDTDKPNLDCEVSDAVMAVWQ